MSLLSRVTAPAADDELAAVVAALFSNPLRTAPMVLTATRPGDEAPGRRAERPRVVGGPDRLGLRRARQPRQNRRGPKAVVLSRRGSS